MDHQNGSLKILIIKLVWLLMLVLLKNVIFTNHLTLLFTLTLCCMACNSYHTKVVKSCKQMYENCIITGLQYDAEPTDAANVSVQLLRTILCENMGIKWEMSYLLPLTLIHPTI